MLYGSETWAVTEADLLRLEHNDMRTIRWMRIVTLKDRKPLSGLIFDCTRNCIRSGSLRWFGPGRERCSDDSVVKKCRDIVVEEQQRKTSKDFVPSCG